ncbi:hypothetical protein BH11MYX2_BH11MYX2_14370 [soil metagenome]
MRVSVAIALCILAACGGKKKQKRSFDAAAVEVVTATGDGGFSPAATDEVEPNDGEDTATPLGLAATTRGRIEPYTDVDNYKLTVTEAGALSVELSAVDGMDLSLEIADAGGTTLAKSDRGGVRVKEGVPNVGVTPGTYRVIVRAKKQSAPKPKPRPKKGKNGAPTPAPDPTPAATASAPVYELTAKVGSVVGNLEREPDDDNGTAMDLIVGDAASGYVGWQGDADVWKLSVETLSKTNAIDIEISAVEGIALTAELTDGVGQPLVTRKAPRGAALVIRGLVPVVADGGPPFHYLLIRADKSNPETAYQLKVTAKVPNPDAEIEPDDAIDKAMPIPEDRTVVHATWTAGDVDCFAIAPDANARTLDITIDTPDTADLDAELFVDGKSVAVSAHPGKGVLEKLSAPVPANAHAVVKVKGVDSGAESSYDISVQEGAAP